MESIEEIIRRIVREEFAVALSSQIPNGPLALPASRHWLTERDVSELTRIPVNTLRSWRKPGKTVLPFHNVGRLIRYDEAEVNEYISASSMPR